MVTEPTKMTPILTFAEINVGQMSILGHVTN